LPACSEVRADDPAGHLPRNDPSGLELDERNTRMLMMTDTNHEELLRLAALVRSNVLAAPRDPLFDRVAEAAKTLFGATAGMVTFVGADRQWYQGRAGVDISDTPRDVSFCSHCIAYRSLLWIDDTLEDPRVSDNPFVTGAPHVRFYAGAPIRDADGWLLGTVCVVDTVPRDFDLALSTALAALADVVADSLD
jgi:GAF domain-containing protein